MGKQSTQFELLQVFLKAQSISNFSYFSNSSLGHQKFKMKSNKKEIKRNFLQSKFEGVFRNDVAHLLGKAQWYFVI